MTGTAIDEIARWCYKNPGIASVSTLTEATGYNRRTVSSLLLRLTELQPKIFQRVSSGVYLVRPPEPEREQEATAVPAEPARQQVTFEEILPDDEDLYPPFKITIYDHFRGKNGDRWFRVKDEHGKRAIFRYIDDE